MEKDVLWFHEITKDDVPIAGGKGANLGEMIRAGFPIPEGFVVTTYAFNRHLEENGLKERIYNILKEINIDDPKDLEEKTKLVRKLIEEAPMPKDLEEKIKDYYKKLGKVRVAVRSSASAEDLPEASFAGQQESYLNVEGDEELINHIKKCWSSLFTPRATYYRSKKGFRHEDVSIAVVVQKMVNSEVSGVMFTKHPVTGEDKVLIEASYGLGEAIVGGKVTPDTYVVDKKTLKIDSKNISRKEIMIVYENGRNVKKEVPEEMKEKQAMPDDLIIELAKIGIEIEKHYNFPQDIEFAIENNKIYIVQSRPITTLKEIKKEEIEEKKELKILLKGLPASPGIGIGRAKIILGPEEFDKFDKGDILVTTMTNPDFVPIMKKAAAIVTDEGGVTSHAAIVSRELGIPCFPGYVRVITDKGLLTFEYIWENVANRESLKVLSFDIRKKAFVWKNVKRITKRKGFVYRFYMKFNGIVDYIDSTIDHPILTFNGNTFEWKPMVEIYNEGRIPVITNMLNMEFEFENDIIGLKRVNIFEHILNRYEIVKPKYYPNMEFEELCLSGYEFLKESDVYNLEVDDTENYVVLTNNGLALIAHNCIVGTREATKILKDGQLVTVDATRGVVYEGEVKLEEKVEVKEKVPEIPAKVFPSEITATKVLLIASHPDIAKKYKDYVDGIGLLRLEFLIAHGGKHPRWYLENNRLNEFEDLLFEKLGEILRIMYPKYVIVRTLDMRTDEYRNLEGGEKEPIEANPMMGWHGIRRDLDQPELFKAQIRAFKRLIKDAGLNNIWIMLPFVISPEEVKKAKELMREVGLEPHKDVKLGIMVETPASAIIIEDIIKEAGIDFISFGTNDLTQLTLGIDRNNELVQKLFSEKHPSVIKLIEHVINVCKKYNVETSICGQAGSDPEMARILVKLGIDSISVNPDAIFLVRETVAREERRLLLESLRNFKK